MLIPLGFLAASGAGEAGAFQLLQTTLVTSSQASVSFSNLGTLAAGFKHLQIRAVARSTGSFTRDHFYVRFNSTALTNGHELRGESSGSPSSGGMLIGSDVSLGLMPCSPVASEQFGAFVMDVLDFSATTKNKTIRTLSGSAASSQPVIQLTSGFQNSTSAITSITILGRDGQIAANSRFSLYGIKATA